MKKFILPVLLILTTVLFLSPKAKAQTGADCSYKNYEWESYRCFEVFNSCQKACSDKAKGSYLDEVSPADKYGACMKASDCHGKTKACRDQAWANYQACKNAGKNEEKTPSEKSSGLPVFIGEWFARFSKAIDGLIVFPEVFEAVLDNKFYIAPDIPDITELTLEEMFQGHWYPDKDEEDSYRPPTLTTEEEQRAWSFLPNYIPGEENVTLIKGQSEIKMPTSSDFIPMPPKGGDTLQVTYLDSTVRSNSDMVQLGYAWSADSGSVMNVPKWSEVKFQEPVEVKGLTSHTVKLEQGEIEVKVKNNKPAENQFGVDAGWLGVTVSRTHFWVSQSQNKKLAVIGVYEGEVEVKTRDGKTIKVKPDGGKPGVVVVSRKLSPVKLAVAGVVLTTIIGGAGIIIKRKLAFKSSNKKRR